MVGNHVILIAWDIEKLGGGTGITDEGVSSSRYSTSQWDSVQRDSVVIMVEVCRYL